MANFKIDLNKYPIPRQMPEMHLYSDGVFHTDYGQLFVTPVLIAHAVEKQRSMYPDPKLPVMVTGEAAGNVQKGLIEVASSNATSSITMALDIVTKNKLTRVLTNVFMSLSKNSYPTKIFESEEAAKTWLRQILKDEMCKTD